MTYVPRRVSSTGGVYFSLDRVVQTYSWSRGAACLSPQKPSALATSYKPLRGHKALKRPLSLLVSCAPCTPVFGPFEISPAAKTACARAMYVQHNCCRGAFQVLLHRGGPLPSRREGHLRPVRLAAVRKKKAPFLLVLFVPFRAGGSAPYLLHCIWRCREVFVGGGNENTHMVLFRDMVEQHEGKILATAKRVHVMLSIRYLRGSD